MMNARATLGVGFRRAPALLLLLPLLVVAACDRGKTPPALVGSEPTTSSAAAPALSSSAAIARADAASQAPGASATAAPGPSATASASARQVAPTRPAGRPFLWRLSGYGDDDYLFGTMHLGADPDTSLHAQVWQAFDSAKTVVFEVDINSIGAAEAIAYATLPAGQSLETLLGAKRFDILAEGAGLPRLMLRNLRPAFALSLMVKNMLPDTPPMDRSLQQRASKAGQQLEYLETVEQQMLLLNEAITVKVLRDGIDEIGKTKQLLLQMLDAYQRGDERALTKAAFDAKEMASNPQFYQKIFFSRNAAWVPKIKKLARHGSVFIAVGAGHLVGPRSVVALLRSQGNRVERVAVPPVAANDSEP